MKLSTKILLGFFGFIFVYMTAAFAELRITGTPNVIDRKNSIAETVKLPQNIRYIHVEDFEREVKIIGSDRAELEVRTFKGDALKNLKYSINGDTVNLFGFGSEDKIPVLISLNIPKSSLERISINSSFVTIKDLQQPLLRLSGNAARVWMADNTIEKLESHLSNKSYLEINDASVDTIDVQSETSQLYVSARVGTIRGAMKDKSSLQLHHVSEIQLKKDDSSKINMYQ